MRSLWMRTGLALLLLAAASGRAPAASGEPPPAALGAGAGSTSQSPARPDIKPDAKPDTKPDFRDDKEPPPAPLTTEVEPPEPPPAPLTTETEPPEPPPAPLLTPEQGPSQGAPAGPSGPKDTRATQRQLRGVGWGGVAATLALITAGTVLGVLTQQRSDALSVSTTQLSGGLPPIYDAAQQAAYLELQSQGRTFNDATIACYAVGGALALTSGVLFWNAARLKNKAKQLTAATGAPALTPSIGLLRGQSARSLAGGSLFLTGSF